MFNLIRSILGNLFHDFKSDRFRQVFFLGIANILPDLFIFSSIRVILWKVAGVKISIFGGSLIRKDVWIDYPKNLTVGNNFYINRGSIISAQDKINIGNNVAVGFNVQLITIYHLRNKHNQYIDKKKPINIGDNCQICSSSIILHGTVLKKNNIVMASSLVQGSFNENSLIGGNPAKSVRIVKKSNY
jgi:acetyltransferase-like isoleucine patch superfamily enzyme